MEKIHPKPKLVFFPFKHDEKLPEFLLIHMKEHVKCLAQFFEVTVINEDCDYQQICDRFQPDLSLFESGLNLLTCRRLEIKNVHRCPQIPKAGLFNADAWCETRAGSLSEMDHWGIETFFSICATAREHTPSIADKLFIWPNSIDPDVYRDYGESKLIPVLFTGSSAAQYPWRQKIYKLVSDLYPSLFCPHLGYLSRASDAQVLFGERYARVINASWFVPACGTIAKEVVRKHFEVPACGACLVTERSNALEAAGFVDMENCVFADERDVLEKLDHLFRNLEDLKRIIKAGHDLVQSRHTIKRRDEILQWFKLNRDLKPNEKIVQENPFGTLRIVSEAAGNDNPYLVCNGLHLELLREGDKYLWAGRYGEAEKCFIRCANYMRRMPEPKFKIGLCKLYMGEGKVALEIFLKLIEYTLIDYKARDPDPIEWAYYIVALMCVGKLDIARKRSSEFSTLRHPELDRVRWVVTALTKGGAAPAQVKEIGNFRRSVQRMPDRGLSEWSEQIKRMLAACGQVDLAEKFRVSASEKRGMFQDDVTRSARSGKGLVNTEGDVVSRGANLCYRAAIAGWPLMFGCRRIFSKVLSRGDKIFWRFLHCVEARFGNFLPYALSERRRDEFLHLIEGVVRDESIKTILVIGADRAEGATNAVLMGILGNQNKPTLFCIGGVGNRGAGRWKAAKEEAREDWYTASPSSLAFRPEELAITLRRIKETNGIDAFDVVLIDGSELGPGANVDCSVLKELCKARFVLLDDINKWSNYYTHELLLRRESDYLRVACNLGLRDGYAIFKGGCKDV